jgi:hypothetical protein
MTKADYEAELARVGQMALAIFEQDARDLAAAQDALRACAAELARANERFAALRAELDRLQQLRPQGN